MSLVPFKRIALALAELKYKSSKVMYLAPSRTNAASEAAVIVSFPVPPLNVIVFDIDEPFTSLKEEDVR